MERLTRDLQLIAPEFTLVSDQLPDGSPALKIEDASANIIAYVAINPLHFNGFQVVAELSSSAAEGLPEHRMWLAINTSQSAMNYNEAAVLVQATARIGCAQLNLIVTTSALSSAIIADANITRVIPNDARLGASGA
jgi:hypothetical protein